MSTNGLSKAVHGEEFFCQLKTNFKQTYFSRLSDYIKKLTGEFSQEQSFYVLDLADILWKIQLWYEKLPGITPFYAVKANADPVLVRLFVLLGFSFDCSTKGEIDLILQNGGKPENIIYAHTIKPHSSLQYASEVGVDLLTFDSEEELIKVKKNFPNARLVIRIKADNPHCSYDLSQKYGCPVKEAERLLIIAEKLKLQVIGISFHVGALCEDPKSFTKTIRDCREIFKKADRLGFKFNLVDLGGGFFGSAEREAFFDDVAKEIQKAVKEYFPDGTVKVIAEPGCYFVGSAQKNVTSVLGSRSILKNSLSTNINRDDKAHEEIRKDYFVNDGYYGSFFRQNELYDITPKPLLDKEEIKRRPIYESKIWGQTCCCEDYIREKCLLPEMQAGEFLVWENMGAYTQGVCTTFTVVPIPGSKRIFIKNSRLNLDWIPNREEVSQFLAENTVLIEQDDFSEMKFC